MTPNDQLTELWELLGKGTHGAWPMCIKIINGNPVYFAQQSVGKAAMGGLEDEHALAIVRDHIEGWLRSKQWAKHDNPRNGLLYYSVGPDAVPDADTLTDAVRYALGKESE